jgi:hypothetical protein
LYGISYWFKVGNEYEKKLVEFHASYMVENGNLLESIDLRLGNLTSPIYQRKDWYLNLD